jgi:hypothetical protein
MGYLKELEATIQTQKDLVECLKKRVEILLSNKVDDEYLMNENQITIIKTNAEINSLTQVIFEKQRYFEKYCKTFDQEYADMERNYVSVMEKASRAQNKHEGLRMLVNSYDRKAIEKDKELKLEYYKKIVSLL